MKRLLVLCIVIAAFFQQTGAMHKKIVVRHFIRSGRAFFPITGREGMPIQGVRDGAVSARLETSESRLTREIIASEMSRSMSARSATPDDVTLYKLRLLAEKAGLVKTPEQVSLRARCASRLGLMFLHDRGCDGAASVFSPIACKLIDINLISTRGEIDPAVMTFMQQAFAFSTDEDDRAQLCTTPLWERIMSATPLVPDGHESIKHEVDRVFEC